MSFMTRSRPDAAATLEAFLPVGLSRRHEATLRK
jgi:hypothetical protein